MTKRIVSVGLLVALFGLANDWSPVLAQDKPLRGSVQMHVDPAMRIDRSTMRHSTGVQSNDFYSQPLMPQQPQMAPLFDPRMFQGNAQSQAPSMLRSVASQTQINKPKEAPYIWYQSAMGGYYDASGTTKELVRANRLHLFGGKFEDGTPVPKTEIRDYNAMGHAFRQPKLNTAHFWNH